MAVSRSTKLSTSAWFAEETMHTIRRSAAPDEQLDPIQEYQKELYTDYWGQANGRITDSVLHLAYLADKPGQIDPPFPDLVRAEYERLDVALEVYVEAIDPTGGAFLIYGQSGAGKSRSLRYLKARKFERKEPVIVTDTGRDAFDLFCEDGAFFDIPLKLLERNSIVPLRPILVLVDVDRRRPDKPMPATFNVPMKNIVTCFATSPVRDRYRVQERNFLDLAVWVIDLWPDNELNAFDAHRQVPLNRFVSSPHVYLTPSERPSAPKTHLPLYTKVVPPPRPDDLDKLFQLPAPQPRAGGAVIAESGSDMLVKAVGTADTPTQADESSARIMPSLFLPDISTTPPSYTPSSGECYTFSDCVHYMGRIAGRADKFLRYGVRRKTSNPRQDLFPRLNFGRTLDILLAARTYKPSAAAYILSLPTAMQPDGFDRVFLVVPTPGVPRPNEGGPVSTITPASPAVQDWLGEASEAPK